MTPRARPVLFGEARPRFGWIHRPIADAAEVALVIVPPFGYEAICAHRALRHLAETAARAGLLAIRFDLDGTFDSIGDDLDGDRVESWLTSIADACDLARDQGAERIVLAGIRLGAALATLAAGRRRDVVGLVAIAAVVHGKALVRELKMLQGALGLQPPPAGTAPLESVDEVVGFAITGETRAGVSKLDLVGATQRPAPTVLVIDRDDVPANDRWIAKLVELGADVQHRQMPGYVEMVLDPHRTELPSAIIAATIEFATTLPAPPSVARVSGPVSVTTSIALAGGITEELVELDDHMFGVVTRPASPARRAVILVNSGAIHRVGPNRLYVALAHRLAARGDLVLRVDLSGIGDGQARLGALENVVYSEHAIADVGVAVGWAKREGATTIVVGGVCSGAYHALKAAVAGHAIDTIVPINPLTFFWKPGMPLDFADSRVTEEAQRYGKSVRSAASWKKLLRGDVNLRHAAEIVVRRVRDVAENRGRDVLRRLRVPIVDDLGSELLALGRKGVAMRFIFSAEDPGRAMLLEQGGSAVARLQAAGKLSIEVLEGTDHTFTPRWSHPLLLDAFVRAVSG